MNMLITKILHYPTHAELHFINALKTVTSDSVIKFKKNTI